MKLPLIGAALAAVGTLASGIWAIDGHYARASDVKDGFVSITKQIELNRLSSEVASLENRRSTVVDRIYDAQTKRTRSVTPADQAVVERYNTELKDVDTQLRDKRRQADQLRGKP